MDPAVCQGRPTSHLQHRWNQGEGWGGGGVLREGYTYVGDACVLGVGCVLGGWVCLRGMGMSGRWAC